VNFEILEDSLQIKDAEIHINLLDRAIKSKDLKDLAGFIFEIPDAGWIWLDVFMGIVFQKSQLTKKLETYDAKRLWTKALSGWVPWFK